jgi:hypothetical protein
LRQVMARWHCWQVLLGNCALLPLKLAAMREPSNAPGRCRFGHGLDHEL